MNLKWRYILFGAFFLISYGILLYEILHINKWYFLAGEILLIGMIVLYILFYNRLLKPIQTIGSGIALLKEKDFNTYLTKVGQKEVDEIIDLYNRMVEQLRQKKIEKEEQNHFLDLLIDASPLGIIILDLEEKVLQLNPAAMNLLGLTGTSEAIGRNLNMLESPLANKIANMRDYGTDVIQLDGMNHYKVHKKYFMDKGFQRPFIMIEELTREWLKVEKQSYEKVIRMMSHEVNNTVGSINSVLHSVRNLYGDNNNDETAEEVKEALEVSIERNENMNRFMSNFASVVRLPPPNKKEISLTRLLKQIRTLYKAEFDKRNIAVKIPRESKELWIYADQSQMEQVLTNVVKNSIEAIEANGEIQLITEHDPPSLRIIDNGMGISSESLPMLFTPFYSDKKEGQGIGLTFVREVLLAHDFYFSLRTLENNWTEFFVKFNND